jgi:hypothetical protein
MQKTVSIADKSTDLRVAPAWEGALVPAVRPLGATPSLVCPCRGNIARPVPCQVPSPAGQGACSVPLLTRTCGLAHPPPRMVLPTPRQCPRLPVMRVAISPLPPLFTAAATMSAMALLVLLPAGAICELVCDQYAYSPFSSSFTPCFLHSCTSSSTATS